MFRESCSHGRNFGITRLRDVFLVVRENRYASRVVEVEQEQKVISNGPYAIIRHPMYWDYWLCIFFLHWPLVLTGQSFLPY